jgi:hypothetical protein
LTADSPSIGPVPSRSGPAPALLPSLLGVTGILAALYGVALVLAAVGFHPAGVLRALDPAQPGSLPELWVAFELGLAALLPLAMMAAGGDRFGLLPFAALPLTLLAAETTDIAARSAPWLEATVPASLFDAGWFDSAAKLFAWFLIGISIGWPVLRLATGPRLASRAVGRQLLAWLLLAGGASVALDLLGAVPELRSLELKYGLAVGEELVELLLYAVVAGAVLDHMRAHKVSKFD